MKKSIIDANNEKEISDEEISRIFNLKDIKNLLKSFSKATGVASVIVDSNGLPIFNSGSNHSSPDIQYFHLEPDHKVNGFNYGMPNNSRHLTEIYYDSKTGLLSGCIRIIIEEKHIADWILYHVIEQSFKPSNSQISLNNDHSKIKYNDDKASYKRMSFEAFEQLCHLLYMIVQMFIKSALLTITLNEKLKVINHLNTHLEKMVFEKTEDLESINSELEEMNAELEETNAALEQEIIEHKIDKEEIIKLNKNLEEKVKERTHLLEDINITLEEEISERVRFEEALEHEKGIIDAIFNSVPGMIYLFDDQGSIIRWNKKYEEMSGYTFEELSKMRLLDWFSDDEESKKAVMNGVRRCVTTGFGDAEVKFQTKDKKSIPMYFTASPVTIEAKQCFAGMGVDMTDILKMEEELKLRDIKYEKMIANIADMIAILDKDGNIKYQSPNIKRWYNKPAEYFVGMNFFDFIHEEDYFNVKSAFDELIQTKRSEIKVEYRHKDINGYRTIELVAVNMLEDNVIDGILINYRDISDRKVKEEENIYLSYHDCLTGLYNRRFYEAELMRLDNQRNLPISVVIGDVNGLKLFNDAFGHKQGDELLKKAAQAFKKACRASDIVARWGGDEFVILLPESTKEDAENIIKRIKANYENELVNAIQISISFGYATKASVDEDIRMVLKIAEDNMYKHKIIENQGVKGNIINTIINTLHEKNPREEQHSKRVGQLCQRIGEMIGLSAIEIARLKTVGLLHDIGKIAIEESILNKTGGLTEDEYDQIKRHPDIGYRILSSSYETLDLAECILAHHERWDGKGYPKGLRGTQIPSVSRIIAIADTYDAITSERPYRHAKSKEVAIKEIQKNAGTQFDPMLAQLFIEHIANHSW